LECFTGGYPAQSLLEDAAMKYCTNWRSFCMLALLTAISVAVLVSAQDKAPQDKTPKSLAPPSDAKGSGHNRPLVTKDFLIQHPDLGGTRLIGLHAESNAPDLAGMPTVASRDRRYYYLPPIALKAKDGELLVSTTADGEITLPVIWDRPETRRIFEEHLIKYSLLAEKANEGQIQVVTARAIRIETPPNYVPRAVFGLRENFEFTNYEGILTASVSPALAQKFVKDLKEGRLELTAVIALEGYDFRQNMAIITYEDIADTRYYKNMSGGGGPGLISRHQVANVAYEAATSRDISLTTEFDDPDFRKLVSDLLADLEKKPEQLKKEWASLGEFFSREGWDPEDFRADLITRSKLDRNSEYQSRFRDDLRLVASDKRKGGGFSLGLFGVNLINTESKGEDEKYREWAQNVTRDVLDKWSLEYFEEGKRILPKSVTAYRNDFSQLRAKGTFRVGQRKKFQSEAIKTIAIHPNLALQSPAKAPFEVRQAELAAKMAELETTVTTLKGKIKTLESLPRVEVVSIPVNQQKATGADQLERVDHQFLPDTLFAGGWAQGPSFSPSATVQTWENFFDEKTKVLNFTFKTYFIRPLNCKMNVIRVYQPKSE
jgi:hypothetical protein